LVVLLAVVELDKMGMMYLEAGDDMVAGLVDGRR
jgi:hypothetical protein